MRQIQPTQTEQVQLVLNYQQAQATAAEIETWRGELRQAEQDLEDAKERLEENHDWMRLKTLKERRKELMQRIEQGQAGLCRGLANARK